LNYFFYLIPTLTLNYIDSLLIAKERIGKKNAVDAYISDDGFVLGITYFLKMLNQTESFGSLHWKDEVRGRFEG